MKVEEHIRGGYGWLTADRRLPYELLLDVDCFLFEFRSFYEILGTFLHRFFEMVLGRKVTEDEILATLGTAGIDISWVEDLRQHRILFFHRSAPWVAVSIDTPEPGDRELLILHSPNSDPTDPKQVLTFSRLRAIYGGLESALHKIQQWALVEIDRLDTGANAT